MLISYNHRPLKINKELMPSSKMSQPSSQNQLQNFCPTMMRQKSLNFDPPSRMSLIRPILLIHVFKLKVGSCNLFIIVFSVIYISCLVGTNIQSIFADTLSKLYENTLSAAKNVAQQIDAAQAPITQQAPKAAWAD